MQRNLWGILFRQRYDADISCDDCIRAAVLQQCQIIGQCCKIVIGRDDVYGGIALNAVRMRLGNAGTQLVGTEVCRSSTHTEGLTAHIDRVRTVCDGIFHFFKVTSG